MAHALTLLVSCCYECNEIFVFDKIVSGRTHARRRARKTYSTYYAKANERQQRFELLRIKNSFKEQIDDSKALRESEGVT